jgi:hypothetical protein
MYQLNLNPSIPLIPTPRDSSVFRSDPHTDLGIPVSCEAVSLATESTMVIKVSVYTILCLFLFGLV